MQKYSSYILFLMITLLVVVLNLNGFGPLDSAQRSINDMMSNFMAPQDQNQNIVIVNIDQQTQDQYGQWPWDHDLTADLLAACGSGEPKTIALDFIIESNILQDSAGHTKVLADQLSWIKNVVMPYDIVVASFRNNRTNNPKYLYENSVTVGNALGMMDETSSLQVRKVFLPPEKVLGSKPKLGFDYFSLDDDRILRHHALVMNYEGYYYPSLPLIAAASYFNIPADQITVNEFETIEFGFNHIIPINDASEMYTSFPGNDRFRQISAAAVLKEGFNLTQLKDKLILVTVDDFETNQYFNTLSSDQTSEVFVKASIIDNIISGNLVKSAAGTSLWQLIILFTIGGICAFALPQVSSLYRWVILIGGLFILSNATYFMLSSFSILPNTIYIGLELILFAIASPILESELIRGEKLTSNKNSIMPKVVMPENKNDKSDAKEEVPVRQLKDSVNDSVNVRTAHIELEDIELEYSKNDEKDTQIDDHQSISLNENSENIPEETVEDTSAFDPSTTVEPTPEVNDESDNSSDSDNLDIEDVDFSSQRTLTADSVKQLGRYQISGTLGKGAMGHVYLGTDPAINRPVALKTIRLDFVNDPEEMEELKERLHREAQAAGKLSHPNIVTIYDVGSEGHLQYIAMEFLEGKTLEELIKRKVKFNFRIISKIIIQICSALEYAHENNIVHRDIKPANIMVLPNYSISVMDFGIARVDSNSMTKTGIAMGTPNYISPEQLKGNEVDKRADIFSLGVVIYELLLGRRPFKGENITSLIYSIINDDPEKPSNVNPQIPLLFDHIVGKALSKDPANRYQRAKDLMSDLNEFVESFV